MSFWGIAAIVLLGAAAFYVLLLMLARRSSKRGPLCPSCDQRLRLVEWLRWSGMKDGDRTGGASSYYRCNGCNGRFKQEINGELEVVGDGDWWPEKESLR